MAVEQVDEPEERLPALPVDPARDRLLGRARAVVHAREGRLGDPPQPVARPAAVRELAVAVGVEQHVLVEAEGEAARLAEPEVGADRGGRVAGPAQDLGEQAITVGLER